MGVAPTVDMARVLLRWTSSTWKVCIPVYTNTGGKGGGGGGSMDSPLESRYVIERGTDLRRAID